MFVGDCNLCTTKRKIKLAIYFFTQPLDTAYKHKAFSYLQNLIASEEITNVYCYSQWARKFNF